MCRVLSHEFGVVRLYRTFCNYIFTAETRCAGCLWTSSGWFKRIEPPLTFSNHFIAKKARCVEFVRGGSTVPNLLEPHHCRATKVCRVLSHEFGVVRLYRTFCNYIFTEETRCAGCLCTNLGWFKHIEPPRTFSSSGWFDCTEPF